TALSTPFPARGFGVGVIDHPDPGVTGESARTPAVTGAPAASKITAAPVAAATRLIRPRIATPPPSTGKPLAARKIADKPGSSAWTRGARRETENSPPLLGANLCTDLTLASTTGRKVRPRQATLPPGPGRVRSHAPASTSSPATPSAR